MRKTTLAVCGVVAALAALTACGSGGTTTGAAAPAPKVTTIADLAKLVSSRTAAVHTTHATMDIKTAGQAITAEGDVSFAGKDTKVRMSMAMPSLGGNLSMVLVGSAMYMQLPQSLVKTEKPWVKIDANGTDPASQALSAVVSQEQQSLDPSQILSQIADYGKIVSHSQATVAGQPATHYVVSVDTAKMVRSPKLTPQMKQMLSTAGAALPPTLDYDIWINSDNLPVKFSMDEKVTVKGSAPQQVSVTGTYTDWGKPVDISAPPASEVGPLPSH
jgi:hypothetical protein